MRRDFYGDRPGRTFSSEIPRASQRLLACPSCHTGGLVFQGTGVVGNPQARVFKCNCCGFTEQRTHD